MSDRIEENLYLFNNKCAKLDVPPDCYPDPVFLKKIFRQNLSFFELFLQKTDTKHEVENIRKNILVAHMINSVQDNKSVSLKIPKSLPKEFKKYVTFNTLQEKLKDKKDKLRYLEQEELTKLETLKTNELKIVMTKESQRVSKAKTDILQAKLIEMNRAITKEEALQKKIKDVTPAKFSSSNSVGDFYNKIGESIQFLKDFSTNTNVDENANKDAFWNKIESCLKHVPNNLLFQMILKKIDSQIDDSCLSNIPLTRLQPIKLSESLLPYLYQHKIISGIEMIAQQRNLESCKKVCAENIQTFEQEVEGLLNASIDSFQFEEDDIVGEFLSVLMAKVNLEGKIKYCTETIRSMKEKIESNLSILQYERLVNETRSIYNFIDEKIATIQEHVALVHQINEKINFSKISIMRLIQSLKIEKSQQYNRALLNQALNNTVIAQREHEISIPNHGLEVQQFLETSLYSFDKALKMNGIFINTNEDTISNIIYITGHFLDPHYFLDVLEKRIKFNNQIISLWNEPMPSREVLDVNSEILLKQRFENSEQISSMFDEISKLNLQITLNLRTIKTLFDFAFKNPLKKFVPKTKKFEGKSYDFYEKDYMLYYEMIKH